MRLVIVLALLLLPPATARASINFLGHDPTAVGCRVFLDWSSDFGGDWTASRPFTALVSNYDVEADTARTFGYGSLQGGTHVTVAPAGPASFAGGPVLRVRMTGNVITNGVYGHTAASTHAGCLRVTPPGSGGLVHWGIRWRRVTVSSPNGMRYTELRGPAGPILAGAGGADSGFVSGTLPGTTSAVCGFLADQEWIVWAGNAAFASGSFDVDVYLDDAAPTLDADVSASAPATLELSPPRPSPVRGEAAIEYALPSPGAVEAQVLDVAGRVVRTRDLGARPAGRHALSWSADEGGERLGAGVYFLRVVLRPDGGGGAQSVTRRVVVTR